MSTLIQVSELSLLTEDKEPVFQDISFHVEEGEVAVLTGLDSQRQSALLHTLIGELEPDSGQILMVGRNVVRISEDKLLRMRRKDLGYLPKNFILPQRRVRDGLRFKMNAIGLPYESESKIQEVLEDLGLSGEAESFPSELSPWEQFKYAVSLAVVHRPRLLLCEEPETSLSAEGEMEVFDFLGSIAGDLKLTVLSTASSVPEGGSDLHTISLDGGGVWSQGQ